MAVFNLSLLNIAHRINPPWFSLQVRGCIEKGWSQELLCLKNGKSGSSFWTMKWWPQLTNAKHDQHLTQFSNWKTPNDPQKPPSVKPVVTLEFSKVWQLRKLFLFQLASRSHLIIHAVEDDVVLLSRRRYIYIYWLVSTSKKYWLKSTIMRNRSKHWASVWELWHFLVDWLVLSSSCKNERHWELSSPMNRLLWISHALEPAGVYWTHCVSCFRIWAQI